MATQKALAVPELLERIISYVPAPRILASAQRVSREWKAVIDSSPAIRRRIWLGAPGKQVISPVNMTTFNPEGQVFSATNWHMWTGMPIYNGVYELNMLGPPPSEGTTLFPGCKITYSSACVRSTSTGIVSHLHLGFDVSHYVPGVEISPDADPTWRSMQIADPPVSLAWVCRSIFSDTNPKAGAVVVSAWATTGVTFGLVSDVLEKLQAAVIPTVRTDGHAMISLVANGGFDLETAGEVDLKAKDVARVTSCGNTCDCMDF